MGYFAAAPLLPALVLEHSKRNENQTLAHKPLENCPEAWLGLMRTHGGADEIPCTRYMPAGPLLCHSGIARLGYILPERAKSQCWCHPVACHGFPPASRRYQHLNKSQGQCIISYASNGPQRIFQNFCGSDPGTQTAGKLAGGLAGLDENSRWG